MLKLSINLYDLHLFHGIIVMLHPQLFHRASQDGNLSFAARSRKWSEHTNALHDLRLKPVAKYRQI